MPELKMLPEGFKPALEDFEKDKTGFHKDKYYLVEEKGERGVVEVGTHYNFDTQK